MYKRQLADQRADGQNQQGKPSGCREDDSAGNTFSFVRHEVILPLSLYYNIKMWGKKKELRKILEKENKRFLDFKILLC